APPLGALVALSAALPATSSAAIARPLAPSAWVQLSPANAPPPRAAQAMAYDRAARDVVVFGGYDAAAYLNDTWTWQGGDWTQADTPVAPPARAGAGIAYDLVTKQL